jgi:hypothetical protein
MAETGGTRKIVTYEMENKTMVTTPDKLAEISAFGPRRVSGLEDSVSKRGRSLQADRFSIAMTLLIA